jgi:hypothetical protein
VLVPLGKQIAEKLRWLALEDDKEASVGFGLDYVR